MVALGLTLAACSGGLDSADDDDVVPPDAAPDRPDSALSGPEVAMQTSLGTMVVRLAQDEMPITTANFLAYVDAAFYDGTLVHRVVDDWVIQGGGYTTGLEPKTPNPPIALETNPEVSHVHGAISMARTDNPNSATSQWFIVDWPDTGTPPQPAQLDGEYAAFGELREGFDVLQAITQVPTQSTGGLDDVPVTEVVVISARRR
jgi:cyclophilin family peptidyl-prolyl cis-trans isomerase